MNQNITLGHDEAQYQKKDFKTLNPFDLITRTFYSNLEFLCIYKIPSPFFHAQQKKHKSSVAMAKRLIPTLNRVLIEKITAPAKTNAGILLPENSSKVSNFENNCNLLNVPIEIGQWVCVRFIIACSCCCCFHLTRFNFEKVLLC